MCVFMYLERICLTITGLSDTMDPETAGIGKQGGTVYPLSRVYSFGLSVNF